MNETKDCYEKRKARRYFRRQENPPDLGQGKRTLVFSVVDVVFALTESANPTDYLKKLRKRDSELTSYIGTNCPLVEMFTEAGKRIVTNENLKLPHIIK